MSELQTYYDAFRQGLWADADESRCLCHGSGWALSDVDTWHQCPIHYKGQLHPDSYDGNDDPDTWDMANRMSMARHTKQVDPVLVEAGVQLPTGEVACGCCGRFRHLPPEPHCYECGDGDYFPPTDCPHCKDAIQREIAEALGEVPSHTSDIPF